MLKFAFTLVIWRRKQSSGILNRRWVSEVIMRRPKNLFSDEIPAIWCQWVEAYNLRNQSRSVSPSLAFTLTFPRPETSFFRPMRFEIEQTSFHTTNIMSCSVIDPVANGKSSSVLFCWWCYDSSTRHAMISIDFRRCSRCDGMPTWSRCYEDRQTVIINVLENFPPPPRQRFFGFPLDAN